MESRSLWNLRLVVLRAVGIFRYGTVNTRCEWVGRKKDRDINVDVLLMAPERAALFKVVNPHYHWIPLLLHSFTFYLYHSLRDVAI